MSGPSYGFGARLLHWAHALLIVGLLGWGWWMAELPKGAERGWAIGLHKSFGLIAIALVLVRLAWRRAHPPPPHDLPTREALLAEWGHRLLYLLLLLVPLAGYASASFTNYPMKFFGLALPKTGWPDETLNALFNTAHKGLAWALAGLILLHLGAVILHALQGRSVLHRMWPGRR